MTALCATMGLMVILFGGWGAAYLLAPAGKSLAAMMAHAWLLGAVIVSLLLGLLGTVLTGASLLAAVTILAVMPGGVALRRWLRERNRAFAWPRPAGLAEWALCAVILCECIVLARYAWTTAIGWDGMVVWEVKARIAFSNGGSLPLDYFTDPTRAFTHPEYPLMLPMLETWVYLWIGKCDQNFARAIFPPFYLAALLLVYSGGSAVSGRRWIGLLTAGLIFFVPFLTTGQTNAFTGYSDFPLALFYLAAVVSFIRYRRDPVDSHAILFALYAGAMPWIKREGSLLWLCFIMVAGLELLRRRKPRLALLAAVPGVVAIAGWKLVLFSTRALPGTDFMPVTVTNVAQHTDRIGTILHAVATELSLTTDWSILWLAFPVTLFLLAAGGKRNLALQLGAIVLMPLSLYSGIYILSNWPAYQAHIDCSLPRLISHLSLVALLTLGVSLPALRQQGS